MLEIIICFIIIGTIGVCYISPGAVRIPHSPKAHSKSTFSILRELNAFAEVRVSQFLCKLGFFIRTSIVESLFAKFLEGLLVDLPNTIGFIKKGIGRFCYQCNNSWGYCFIEAGEQR